MMVRSFGSTQSMGVIHFHLRSTGCHLRLEVLNPLDQPQGNDGTKTGRLDIGSQRHIVASTLGEAAGS